MRLSAFLIACVVAAIAPLLFHDETPKPAHDAFPGWPVQIEGRALRPLPLTALEMRFAADFPGRIARFSDGEREIVIRWVAAATRKLHPASDCFRGSGYTIAPQSLVVGSDKEHWASFLATRGEERLLVRERIYDERAQEWTDVSAWYWDTLRGRTAGPWWTVTIAARRT